MNQVSFASFVVLYAALVTQREELRLQRVELGLQREELRQTRDELKRSADEQQRAADAQAALNARNDQLDYDTTLFALIDAVRKSRDEVVYVPAAAAGGLAFPRIMNAIRHRAIGHYNREVSAHEGTRARFTAKQLLAFERMAKTLQLDLDGFFEGGQDKRSRDAQFLSSHATRAYLDTMREEAPTIRPFIATTGQLLLHLERAPAGRRREYEDLVGEQFTDAERALIAVASLFQHFHGSLKERIERTRFMRGIDHRADPLFGVLTHSFAEGTFYMRE